ncbi:2OG-Fe(II) oxygenase [Burkholderia sp. FERM BP-3421]|uniref:2OG-Fe(II) oxygenase n=1 Tax=Burkholderia sp. FERM BP-3421 TaxID=1494466 RepID=UPI002360F56A|nr:2OG-Fe(II) oxygenase [Burkholderia sp. FERM BP-3421]WDD93152.1 2OG-Fe(II) oxygenase [Burkholderia sp. FERM BP-3421]
MTTLPLDFTSGPTLAPEAETSPAARLGALDWPTLEADLATRGYAILPSVLTPDLCRAAAALYDDAATRFRSRVVMSRHHFGQGEYRYFSYPLPEPVADLRAALYPLLAPIANRWHAALRIDARFPAEHAALLARCHAAGQRRPTPLMLRYRAGDYCCLHQDLYGEHVFPLQAVFLLDEPGRDFGGGELMLTEQAARGAPRAEIVPLRQGDGVVFAVNHRPVRSARGFARASMRHGVSRVHDGQRTTLGLIFHDAA